MLTSSLSFVINEERLGTAVDCTTTERGEDRETADEYGARRRRHRGFHGGGYTAVQFADVLQTRLVICLVEFAIITWDHFLHKCAIISCA